jgi:hypothetical protein
MLIERGGRFARPGFFFAMLDLRSFLSMPQETKAEFWTPKTTRKY